MRLLRYIGCLLLSAYPAMAAIVVFGHHQGRSGQSTSQPGVQVVVYEVRLVNDGNSLTASHHPHSVRSEQRHRH